MCREAMTRGSGDALCSKSTFSSLPLNRTREARTLRGFRHHNGESLFCFVFSDPIIVGLRTFHSGLILQKYHTRTSLYVLVIPTIRRTRTPATVEWYSYSYS